MRASAVLAALTAAACAWGPTPVKVVCLDPGHPSENGSGTRGKTLSEVEVVWKVAIQVREKLTRAGIRVVMTKGSQGQSVTNQKRSEIANAANADLMLRLHCDAASSRGFSVYYPARAGTVRGITGPSAAVIQKSRRAAKAFHAKLAEALKGKLPDRGLFTDGATSIGAKQGALTGSIFSKVPVLLVEMLVLTNAEDERFAGSKEGREALSTALAEATLAALR